MSAPVKMVSFSGGEIAPYLYARTDQQRYETSVRTLRNFISMRHGGATNRPGTQYVYTTQNGGNQVRLIPFIFNETGLGQSYVLEFGNEYIAFYQNGGVITSGGLPYKISSPYLQADLATLKFAECNDIITIVHPNYPPYELKRIAATNWTLTQIVFGATIVAPVMISGDSFPPVTTLYNVTAISATGEEGPAGHCFFNAAPTSAAPLLVSWEPVTGAVSYRVYRSTGNGSALGFIGAITGTSFSDPNITPDYTNTQPFASVTFDSANNYPSVVGFAQQRRVFAATNNNPVGFWMSMTGLFYNFNTHPIPSASDAITGSLAGDELNSIQAILELKFPIALTTGTELYLQGDGSGVLAPGAVNASVQSQYGCNSLRPIKVGDVVLFNQALGSFIRDLAFDFAIDGYRGNDITIFSSHLFENYQIVDWAYQKVPDSIIWAVRSDGTLLGLTYVREQQILAWHRHDFTNGTVENVCCIPENGVYSLYLSIKRTINGSTVRYIERLSSRLWTDIRDATYLDCYSSYNGVNSQSITMALSSPTGTFIQDGTAYQQSLTLTSNGAFFTSGMVGDQIFMNDALFNENQSKNLIPSQAGVQIRCTILAYISATQVTVAPNRAVPTDLQNTPIFTWSRAVNKVTGLNYLIGEKVSVWADRFVVSSPNNTNVSLKTTVASDGSITLDKAYSVIYVGLPITSDIETLDLETSFGEAITGKRRRQNIVRMHIYNSRDIFAGSENPDSNTDNLDSDPLFQLQELKRGEQKQTYDSPPQLITDGQDWIIEDTRWNKNGRIFLRNVDPVPVTFLAISPGNDIPSQSPPYAVRV